MYIHCFRKDYNPCFRKPVLASDVTRRGHGSSDEDAGDVDSNPEQSVDEAERASALVQQMNRIRKDVEAEVKINIASAQATQKRNFDRRHGQDTVSFTILL